jgi:hypothetical protein
VSFEATLQISLTVCYRIECLQRLPNGRPTMSAVRKALETKASLQPDQERSSKELGPGSEFETKKATKKDVALI